MYRPFPILSSFIFWHLSTSVGSELTRNTVRCTMEALISGHPRDVKKVSIPGAGRLRECKNTEFVWELRKMVSCEGGRR